MMEGVCSMAQCRVLRSAVLACQHGISPSHCTEPLSIGKLPNHRQVPQARQRASLPSDSLRFGILKNEILRLPYSDIRQRVEIHLYKIQKDVRVRIFYTMYGCRSSPNDTHNVTRHIIPSFTLTNFVLASNSRKL